MPRQANTPRDTPVRKAVVAKPQRVPVGGYRDILEVYGKDPAYHYRWVDDTSEEGGRIATFIMGGYEMADANQHNVPKQHTFTSENRGSVVRLPNRSGGFLYLMRIRKEFFDEDFVAKQTEIDSVERQIMEPNSRGEDLEQYAKSNHNLSSSFVRHS